MKPEDWFAILAGAAAVAYIFLGDSGDQQTSESPPDLIPDSPPPSPALVPPPSLVKNTLPALTQEQMDEIWAKLFPDSVGTANKLELTYMPPVDDCLARIFDHPTVVLILGARGSGKSAAAVRIQELLRYTAAPYAVGLPHRASKLLPDWYGLADDFSTIPNNSIIYIPESYRMFHSRSARSAQGLAIGDIVNLSRHRKHTLIFDVQNPAHLDRNILSEVDILLIKEPGAFQQGFERSQFRASMDAARAAFSGLSKMRKKKAVWVVAPGADINGRLMENLLPTFWTDALSRIFGDAPIGQMGATSSDTQPPRTTGARKGYRTSISARKETAKSMRAAGHSYREIGKTLGCSASTAFRLVNG